MYERRNIKQTFVKTKKKVKDFLLRAKSREFFIVLCFFFMAGGFWLLQTLNNDYETNFSIPVKLKNIPDDVVITSEPASEIRVRVKDKGTVLLNYMLGKSFYPVQLNFGDYSPKNNIVKVAASEYEKSVVSQLNASTRLLSMTPDTLEYIYSTGISKRLSIKLCGQVSVGRQYYLSDTIFRPDSVLIYAPVGMLDTVTAVYTQPIILENISDTLVQQTATQIYLPNLRATEAYKTVFMLSDREFQLIKSIDPGSRYFLIKQDNSGVVAKIDLSGMTDVINVLSGRAETVLLSRSERMETRTRIPTRHLPDGAGQIQVLS